MRRGSRWLAALVPVIGAAACGSAAPTVPASQPGHTYRDAAGWAIEVPPGWYAVRFSDSTDGITAAGVQLSNVKIPPPALAPGFPIQANGLILPPGGVGVVIATDTDPTVPHGPLAVPPLPGPHAPNSWKYWNAGSQIAGSPYIEILWFRAHNATFTATAKIGPKATGSDLDDVAAIIQSLRLTPGHPDARDDCRRTGCPSTLKPRCKIAG
jgi:hypothetical protein